MNDAGGWAAALAAGGTIDAPVAVVVAHPDDETLFAGPLLRRLRNGRLIVVTDGAPEDMADARALGIASRSAYAAIRAGELDRAVAALGFAGPVIRYAVADQGAVFALPTLVERLRADLADVALVVTHPYDGGHPDHDAVACAVARAVSALAPAPAVVEFACYAQFDDARVWARFVEDARHPQHTRTLDADDIARVDAALAAHASQAGVFADWRPDQERWRAAPDYDFAAPPPGEACLYDRFGWSLTSARWREAAACR